MLYICNLIANSFILQIYTDPPIQPHIQAVCDNIDAWAMWIAPPIFIVFNVAYWMSYQHTENNGKRLNAIWY